MDTPSQLKHNPHETYAVVGMALGLASTTICCGCLPFSLVALGFAGTAIKNLPSDNPKRPLALVGLCCGIAGLCFFVLHVILTILYYFGILTWHF